MLLLSGILDIEPIRHRSGGSDPRDLHRNGRLGDECDQSAAESQQQLTEREEERGEEEPSEAMQQRLRIPAAAHFTGRSEPTLVKLSLYSLRSSADSSLPGHHHEVWQKLELESPSSPNRLTPAVSLNSAVAAADPSLHPSNSSTHRHPAHSRSSRSEPPTSHRPFVTHSLDRRRFPRSTASRPSVHHLHPSAGVYPPGLSSRPFLAMK